MAGESVRHQGSAPIVLHALGIVHNSYAIAEDALKLQFTLDAMDCENPFVDKVVMPETVKDAIRQE